MSRKARYWRNPRPKRNDPRAAGLICPTDEDRRRGQIARGIPGARRLDDIDPPDEDEEHDELDREILARGYLSTFLDD